MKVGHARFDMTPEGEVYLVGYRHPDRTLPAEGVHDRIWADALLFEDAGGTRMFLLSMDVVEVEESMADEVKSLLAARFGLDRDLVLLTATHDHSSTAAYHRTWWTGHFDPQYYAGLLDRIVGAYLGCEAGLRGATARIGSETVLGHYGNRNHPGEPADNEVSVLEFVGGDGEPFCGIVNWAVHSTVLPASNRWLTADLAGTVREKLAPVLGYHPLMLNGAAGDCSNRHQRLAQDFDELERVSTALAERIGAIAADRPVELGRIDVQTLFHTVHTDDFHLDAKGWVVDLGTLRIFAFPGELGSAFGPQLRGSHPHPSLVAGYTNGYYAYWMPVEEYGLSFETTSSRIPAGEPERLVTKFARTPVLTDR